jgi:hypothetical protein
MFDVSHQTLYIILFYKSHAAEARLGGEPLVSKFTFTRRLKRQRLAAELNVNFFIELPNRYVLLTHQHLQDMVV